MKSPNAQTEAICIKGNDCCISVVDVSKLLDIISKISHVIKLYTSSKDLIVPIAKDIEMARNSAFKLHNSLEVFIKTAINISGERSVEESFIYTMVNILNRLIEVRNRLSRILDSVERSSDSARITILEGIAWLDSVLLRFSLIALAFASKVKKWSRESAGAFSSAIGSAIFASLLDLSNNASTIELLRKCMQSQ
jgi:hypothetical protein